MCVVDECVSVMCNLIESEFPAVPFHETSAEMVGPESYRNVNNHSLLQRLCTETSEQEVAGLPMSLLCDIISCPHDLCSHPTGDEGGREGEVKTGIPAPMCLSSAGLMWSRLGVSPVSLCVCSLRREAVRAVRWQFSLQHVIRIAG